MCSDLRWAPCNALLLALLAAGAAAGCAQKSSDCACPPVHEAGKAETQAFLSKNRDHYERAIRRARAWLDDLTVDPAALRAAGIKGKKKLVELLDAYVRLHAIATEQDRRRILERIKSVVAVTYTPAYHNMGSVGDKQFKQDATSYLRAAWLMERLGLDTAMYRREIAQVHGRLNSHMRRRGPHQRMAFHLYYEHFGLEEPFDLAAGFKAGLITSRLSPYSYDSKLKVYHLTHEVFVPYEFGARLDAEFFSPADRAYLRHTLDRLTVHYIMRDDPDLTAELVSCLRYLRLTELPVYREGLTYLLLAQRDDGKWGSYEHLRKRYGDLVDQGFYLHTTMVAIGALSVAFDFAQQPRAGDET
jgi:hypothetical protein